MKFKYLISLLLGLLVAPYAIQEAYVQRGYFAIGGEVLIPFIFVLLTALYTEITTIVEPQRHKKSTPEGAQKLITLN